MAISTYEQPAIVSDTRQGEIWSRVLGNINAAASNYIGLIKQKDDAEAKRIQDLLDETTKYALNKQSAVYDNLVKLKADPQLYNEVSRLLDLETETYYKARNAVDKEERNKYLLEQSKYNKALGKLYGLLNEGIDSNAFFVENFDSATAGLPGGISKNQEGIEDYITGMSVRTGLKPGKQEIILDENGEWKINIETEDKNISQPAEIFFNYTPTKINDIQKEIQTIYDDAGVTKDGKLGQAFYGNRSLDTKSLPGYMISTINPNIDKIAQTTGGTINAKARALLNDSKQAQAIYSVIRKDSDPDKLDINQVITSEGNETKNLFISRFEEFARKLIPAGGPQQAYRIPNDPNNPGKTIDLDARMVNNVSSMIKATELITSDTFTLPQDPRNQSDFFPVLRTERIGITAENAVRVLQEMGMPTYTFTQIVQGINDDPTLDDEQKKNLIKKLELPQNNGLVYRMKDGKPTPLTSFTRQPNMYGLLETYRTFLGASDQKAFDNVLEAMGVYVLNKKGKTKGFEIPETVTQEIINIDEYKVNEVETKGE
tara:strand:+ start:1165 stop:2796 length:1632 start_codon:yes stop_codon:yes gene_type:complete